MHIKLLVSIMHLSLWVQLHSRFGAERSHGVILEQTAGWCWGVMAGPLLFFHHRLCHRPLLPSVKEPVEGWFKGTHTLWTMGRKVPVVIWWTRGNETVCVVQAFWVFACFEWLTEWEFAVFQLSLTTSIHLALKDHLLACYANHHKTWTSLLNISPHVRLPVKFCE